jgi:hypothetical protein
VFIELPAPTPTIEPEEPDVVFQRNPSPIRRVDVKLCEECYSEVKKMPWTPWEV